MKKRAHASLVGRVIRKKGEHRRSNEEGERHHQAGLLPQERERREEVI